MTLSTMTAVMATAALAAGFATVTVRPPVTPAQASIEVPPAAGRASREFRDEHAATAYPPASPVYRVEHRSHGRKFGSDDEYRTLQAVASDLVVEASAAAGGPAKVYPSLTTGAPVGYVARGRFIRNPFGNFGKDDQEVEFDDDQHAEFMFGGGGGGGGGMPKWNRYNTNHRQLNKYMTTPVEPDITVDEDGSAGYGSTYDVNGGGGGGGGEAVAGGGMGYDPGYYRHPGGGTGYDSGNYKNSGTGGMGYDYGNYRNPVNGWSVGGGDGGGGGGGGGMVGWYNEPIMQASRPLPIIAEIRQPSSSHSGYGHKMSIDITKIGMLALIKIALAKLKALGFVKGMLLLLFKLKLFILLVAMKFLMIAKFTKLALLLPALLSFFTVPMMFSRLSRLHSLLNQPVLVPNNFVPNNMNNQGNNTSSNPTTEESESGRTSRVEPLEVSVPKMTKLGQIIRSEKCLQRVSCRIAGAKKPSLALIWLNWIASPLSTYIPSKKLKVFVATFTEVTNYRLDNLYNNLLPKDWTKWCNDHYACG